MVEQLKCNLHNTFKKSCTSERAGNKDQTILLLLFFQSQHTYCISLSIIWILSLSARSPLHPSFHQLVFVQELATFVLTGHLEKSAEQYLVCNHVTSWPCWGLIQYNFFSKNLHENGVQFPEERNAFFLDHQHDHSDVMCKPEMDSATVFPTISDMDQLGKIWQHHWKECLNPLNRKSDQHQISPCKINTLQSRVVMRITDMITQMNLLDILSTSPHYVCRK